jgi:hypothetical protein
MRRLLAWVFLSVTCFAQTDKLPVIRLNDQSITGLGPFYTKGMGYWIAATDKVSIIAAAEQYENRLAVAIGVRNTSKEAFTFDPSQITAIDLVSGKDLRTVPAHKVANRVRNGTWWQRFGQGFSQGAALAGQESTKQETSTISGDFSGHTTEGQNFSGDFRGTTTTTHNECDAGCAASKQRLIEQFARQDANRSDNAGAVLGTALLKETLLPDAQVLGYVYLSKPRKGKVTKLSTGQEVESTNVTVVVPIAGERFRFYFPTELMDY